MPERMELRKMETQPVTEAPWWSVSEEEWVRHVIGIHFDPRDGAPYWLRRSEHLGFDPRDRIRTIDDLALLGPMPREDLVSTSVSDFIPSRLAGERTHELVAESAGTLGKPVRVLWDLATFHWAFVDCFVRVADATGFPRGGSWLWVGPGGPHIIGRAARHVARALDAREPFSVDFDPRWIKRLAPGSMGFRRYQEHLLEQAGEILEREEITVLFSMPPLLEAMAERMTEKQRMAVRGVHYGGMHLPAETYRRLREELYPNAVHLSGYGNSLFGLCPEVPDEEIPLLGYCPVGIRHIVRFVRFGAEDGEILSLQDEVDYGDRGRLVCSRLDERWLLANVVERDCAIRHQPTTLARELGFTRDMIHEPGPVPGRERVRTGLY